MKKTILLLISIYLPLLLNAQQVTRTWGEGPLSARDFSQPADASKPTVFSGELIQTVISDPTGGIRMMIRAVSDPYTSYADKDALTPQRLAYHQAQFDKLEILARNLQKELSGGTSAKEAERLLDTYNNYYQSELRKMAEATDNGNDPQAVELLAINTRQELNDTPEPASLSIVAAPFSYGLYVATGPYWTTSSLHDALSWAWDFTFGLRIQWKRLRLDAQISYAAPTIKNPSIITDKIKREEGETFLATVNNANYMGIGFDIGVSAIDTRQFSITPFVGGMFGQYTWGVKPTAYDEEGTLVLRGEQQPIAIQNFNLWFGINCEWHINHTVSSSSMLGAVRQELVSSIGITPYAKKGVYNQAIPPFSGWQVGFTISYSGMVRALRIK